VVLENKHDVIRKKERKHIDEDVKQNGNEGAIIKIAHICKSF
jgi:hypothetical protein